MGRGCSAGTGIRTGRVDGNWYLDKKLEKYGDDNE